MTLDELRVHRWGRSYTQNREALLATERLILDLAYADDEAGATEALTILSRLCFGSTEDCTPEDLRTYVEECERWLID